MSRRKIEKTTDIVLLGSIGSE